jgi:hypothetical protein
MYPTTALVATITADRQREAQTARQARVSTGLRAAPLRRPLRMWAAAVRLAVSAHADAKSSIS